MTRTVQCHVGVLQVRDEMSAEAAARQQSLDSVRKHVGDELKATQRSVIGKLEKTDKDLAAHEQAVAKLERALAMVKEDVKGERESRDALKMTLSHGIEAVGDSTDQSSMALSSHSSDQLGRLRLEHTPRRHKRMADQDSPPSATAPRQSAEPTNSGPCVWGDVGERS